MSEQPNVKQAVPFFAVSDMSASLAFYVDGLGFEIGGKWEKDGQILWCQLQLGGAALMLQQHRTEGHDSWVPECKVGEGVAIAFLCEDAVALYRRFKERGVEASEPRVGNGQWVTEMADPDGYKMFFESFTDAEEGSLLSAADK